MNDIYIDKVEDAKEIDLLMGKLHEAQSNLTKALEQKRKDTVDKRYQECVDRSYIFYMDVLAKIGDVPIQGYQNMNELGILLKELKTGN